MPVDCVASENESLAHAGELGLLEEDSGLCICRVRGNSGGPGGQGQETGSILLERVGWLDRGNETVLDAEEVSQGRIWTKEKKRSHTWGSLDGVLTRMVAPNWY